jgi:2-polyprenyl-3-methyl-5-hydroxy-6-metoxy-1,4-benzoquinol methylase
MDRRYSETPRDVFRLVKCNECGLIYLNPIPTKKYLLNFYPSSFYEPRKLRKQDEKRVLRTIVEKYNLLAILKKQALREKVSTVKRHHCTAGRILDIGAAAGEFLFAMKREGWDVLGVEISKSMCDYVLKTYGIRCINSSIDELSVDDLKTNHFDIVTLWATLAHLYDPKQALTLCHRILKPGGKIIILTSNSDSLEEKWFKSIDKNPIDVPRHLYHFSAISISQYFKVIGFNVKETRYFTLNAADRLTVIVNSIINRIQTNNLVIKAVKYSLLNLSTLCGYMLSMLLRVLKRSHTIVVVVGEKVDRLESC